MDLHAYSFEKLLEIASSLDDPSQMKAMIEELERLEKNLRYMRERLGGKIRKIRDAEEKEQRERRKRLKESMHIVTAPHAPDDSKD